MNDDDKAMKAVIDSMGKAAHAFSAKKYAPKPPPAPEPVAEPEAAPGPSAADLEALLNGG